MQASGTDAIPKPDSTATKDKDAKGRFAKGNTLAKRQKGKRYGDLRELARRYTSKSIRTLVSILEDEGAPPAARVSAAKILIEHGIGKPIQQHDVSGKVEHGLKFQVVLDQQVVQQLSGPPVIEGEATEVKQDEPDT